MKRWLLGSVLIAGVALAVPSLTHVSASGTTTIRLASLAPAGSSWDKVFRAWGNTLKKETGGAVKFQFFAGGVAGDERDVLRKMKAGQMDAGLMTIVGLGQVVRSLTLLNTPIFDSYAQMNHVREQLNGEYAGLFAKEGYKLLGWSDAGFARQFAKKPIMTPADYKTVRPWVPRDEPGLQEMMKVVGANGVALGIPEVFPALQTGMVDTVTVSAIAAVALQWFRYLPYMSSNAPMAIIGGTIVREEVVKSLSPDHQKILLETAKKAHAVALKTVAKEDEKAYKTLVGRGIKQYDPMATPAQEKAWKDLTDTVVKRLTGRLWSESLYKKVLAAKAKAPK